MASKAEHGEPDKLILSFHGIPREYFLAGDPYFCECQKTGRLLAEQLGLAADQWQLSFQSRLGPKQWLQPYTDETLESWGKAGVGDIDVICPAFSVDCLETLEEIGISGRESFLAAGGEEFTLIPCLNSDAAWVEVLKELCTTSS